ncbi:MAG: PRC-barrel domain-containing protein, partial [Geodermatophilaceae bacterium]|nr:PRC-barrel domain-containing protein [Geodermatophilaceae bacterium]
MIEQQNADELTGATVQDSSGDKIGKVSQVYLDDTSGQPKWVTVNTGLFGTKESFVPLEQASFSGGAVSVPVSKDQVKGAPQVENDSHLEPAEEAELYRYYGLSAGEADYGSDDRGTVGRDVSGPTTDEAMTRSEERLDVGTEQVETGRARLRKYVTTRTESVQVP